MPDNHRAEATDLTARLHAAGWASHVTVDRLLRDWDQLAREVGDYNLTIDDYTNDLTARDGLDQILQWSSPTLQAALRDQIMAADDLFKAVTHEDEGAAVGRYFRIQNRPGWWWRRRPSTGPLAAYLDGA